MPDRINRRPALWAEAPAWIAASTRITTKTMAAVPTTTSITATAQARTEPRLRAITASRTPTWPWATTRMSVSVWDDPGYHTFTGGTWDGSEASGTISFYVGGPDLTPAS